MGLRVFLPPLGPVGIGFTGRDGMGAGGRSGWPPTWGDAKGRGELGVRGVCSNLCRFRVESEGEGRTGALDAGLRSRSPRGPVGGARPEAEDEEVDCFSRNAALLLG